MNAKTERPIRKMLEHINDALFHLHNADFPQERKDNINKALICAAQLIEDEQTAEGHTEPEENRGLCNPKPQVLS